jgi:hypothetical protein
MKLHTRLCAAFFAALLLLTACHVSQPQPEVFKASTHLPAPVAESTTYPDSAFTPGDIVVHDIHDLPATTRDVRDVTKADATAIFDEYHVPDGNRNGTDFEIDHFVPLSLGGSNVHKNLWPQTRDRSVEWNAWEKDKLEQKLYHLVHNGIVPLAEAQQAITSDWVAAYEKYMPMAIHGQNDFVAAPTPAPVSAMMLAPTGSTKAAFRFHTHYELKTPRPAGKEDLDPDENN